MTTAQVVETSVTVNNSPIQDYIRGDEWSIKIFNCSQNLNKCSFARAPQIFAVARMLASQ